MFRAYRIVAVAAMFFLFFVGGLCLAVLVLPWIRLFGGYIWCRRFIGRGFNWYLQFLRVLRLMDMRFESEGDPPEGPSVIVANHPTILDVVSTTAFCGPVCVVAKHTTSRNLFFLILIKLCGYIDVRYGSLGDTQKLMDLGAQRLAQGESVLIFPEGTRSPDRGMHRFIRAPFDLAAQAQVPLTPMAIVCDPPVLKKHGSILDWPDQLVQFRVVRLPSVRVGPTRPERIRAREEVIARLQKRIDQPAVSPSLEQDTSAATA